MSLIKKLRKKLNRVNYINIDTEPMMILQGKILAELNKSKMSSDIQDYEFKVTSQTGEDGIIQFLINKIPIKNKIFIEFGVENYTEANTRFLLQNDNWSGLIIDGNPNHMNSVKNSTLGWKYDLKTVACFITKDNINDIIKNAGIEGEIGILSVDIDGNDYWVLDAIDCVNPQILIVEYNSMFGPTAKITVPYDENFVRREKHYSNLYYGASISALTELANKKGFSLLGSNKFGNNLFFARQDYQPIENQVPPEKAYVKSKFKESRDQDRNLTYLAHSEGLKLIGELDIIDIQTSNLVKIKDKVISGKDKP